jgi:peptide/nickel transport system permease protein
MYDNVGKVVAIIGQSAPPFWLGIMLIFFFAVRLEWVPVSGRHDWNSFILPSVTLGWAFVAANLRLVRTSMLEVLDSEYIKMARAKGVSNTVVIWKHALRNALIAPITFMGVTVGLLMTGSVVAETVFQWPGVGMLAFTSLQKADFPMLQGIVLTFAAMYILVNLVVDILYAYIDPRIRYG